MNEESLFYLAQQQPDAAARAAFLDEACANQPELRARLDKLLHAHDAPAGLFDRPAIERSATVDNPIHELPGTVIGPYKLLEQIGEGGFGVVFMAEQMQPVRRKVALKVLKPGMDTRQVVARFEAERQALALMDHPHIAHVFDGGETATGRPFFVMELVRGIPITDFCDQNCLSIRERLNLFLHVCQAVRHAHQKGIIHRDLKPSNVLVTLYDGTPVVKVIDFGIAKATGQQLTDKTLFTNFAQMIGTPLYMSPEQASMSSLDVDTRSDIYSLGVLLYELLTGTTPFERERLRSADYEEIRRIIREEEPARPSTRLSTIGQAATTISAKRQSEPKQLSRLFRGELDWIAMKALEKDRNRRYESASAFASDVQRYLHDEPVQACPPSAAYRLRKFVRKNRKWLATATGFAVLLLAAAGVSSWLAIQAMGAEKRALLALDGETQQREQAVRSEADAKAVLRFFQDKVLCAARPKRQEGGLGREATILEALDQAEPEIAQSFRDQPLVEASIRNALGVSYWFLGEMELAKRQQERAVALRVEHLGPEHLDTAGAMNDLAIVLRAQGKNEEALNLIRKVVEAKRRVLGSDDESTLKSVNNLAVALAVQGQLEEASKLVEETARIQRRLLGPDDLFTLRSTYNLAIMRRHLGRIEESRRLFEETLPIMRSVLGREHQDTLRVMTEYGELVLDDGRAPEAYQLFDEALRGKMSVLGPKHVETLIAAGDLADALRALARLEEARKRAEEVVEQHRQLLGAEHPQTLVVLTILANVLRDQGHYAEARKRYEETLPVARSVLGPKTPETQRLMRNFAWMLATASDLAFRDPPRAVALAKEVVGHAPGFTDNWTVLGVASYRAGHWKDAVAALEKAESLTPGQYADVNAFFLAMALRRLGSDTAARRWYDQAMERMNKNQPVKEELRRTRAETAGLLKVNEKND